MRAGHRYPVALLRPKIGGNLGPAPPGAISRSLFVVTGPTLYDLMSRVNPHGQRCVGPADSKGDGTYWGILNGAFLSTNQSIQFVLASNYDERFVVFGKTGDQDTTLCTSGYIQSDTGHTVGAYVDVFFNRIEIGSYTRSGGTYTKTIFTDATTGLPARWFAGQLTGQDALAGAIAESSLIEFKNFGTLWKVLVNGTEVLTVSNSTVTQNMSRVTAALSVQRGTVATIPKQDSFWVFSVTMSDWLPQTSLGSGAKMARTGGGIVALAAGPIVYPVGYYTNTMRSTTDIISDPNNARFTVSVEGWYTVKHNQIVTGNGGISVGSTFLPILTKNTGYVEYGNQYVCTSANLGGIMLNAWDIYLMPGDYVQPYYQANGNPYLDGGNASALSDSFSITLMNPDTSTVRK